MDLQAWADEAVDLLEELHPVVFGCATTREPRLRALIRRFYGDPVVPADEPVKRPPRRRTSVIQQPVYPLASTETDVERVRDEAGRARAMAG